MPKSPSLYDQVVEVTNGYLGPASERFIDRQIQNHLHKDPEKLTRKDLDKLVDWIKIAIALLTDDTKAVNEYTASLMALVRNNRHER